MDNILIDTCEMVCPTLYTMGWTPNIITLLGCIVSLSGILFLCRGNLLGFTSLFFLGYWLDCLDGHYARKYHMETVVGDYFDHVRDITIFVLFVYVIGYKYSRILFSFSAVSILFWLTCFLCTLNMVRYIGCLENAPHSYRPHSPTLHWMKSLCSRPTSRQIQILRFFGQGTFVIIMILLVWILNREEKSILLNY